MGWIFIILACCVLTIIIQGVLIKHLFKRTNDLAGLFDSECMLWKTEGKLDDLIIKRIKRLENDFEARMNKDDQT